MGLINCVECNREISSFANACPYCGCPSEFQINNEHPNNIKISESKLSSPTFWNIILGNVNMGQIDTASKMIIHETGANFYEAQEVINLMISQRSVPEEIIISMFPRQAANNESMCVCQVCRKPISSRAESCPHCGNPTGVHVCPSCGSTNTSVITGEEKGLSMFLFRGYSTNTVMSKFKCKDCGHKW